MGHTYLIPSAGGESTRLLPDFVSVAWPIWSPDGRHLLVTARRAINEDLEWWIVAPDGLAPVKISGFNLVTDSEFPVRPWSWIEGNRIVYSTALGGDSWNLWEVVVAPRTWIVTTEPTRLTTAADLQAHASIVRGTQLVFSSLTLTVNVWGVPVHADSGQVVGPPRKVTATSALQWSPSASENGRRLVFQSDRLATGGLWIRDLEADRARFSSSHLEEPSVRSSQPTAPASLMWTPRKTGRSMPCRHRVGRLKESVRTVAMASSTCRTGQETRCDYCTLSGLPPRSSSSIFRSGDKRRALQRSANSLWQAQFSPDDRWISVLETLDAEGRTKLWVVPFRDGSAPKADEWVGVTRGEHWDDKPRWSPDGNLMYFTSLRDGFLCLWAQRLRPDTKEPTGPAFHVEHFHNARLSMTNTGNIRLETSVTRDGSLSTWAS